MTATSEKLDRTPWQWDTIASAYDWSDFYKELGSPDTIGQTVVFERPGRGTLTYTLRDIRELRDLREPVVEGKTVRRYDFSFVVF